MQHNMAIYFRDLYADIVHFEQLRTTSEWMAYLGALVTF